MTELSKLKDGDRLSHADFKRLGGLAGIQSGRSSRKTDFCLDGNPSESLEQQNLATYLDELVMLYSLRWCHVPNGGARYRGAAGLLKAEGVKKGVLDALIFTPPPGSLFVGLAIELKRKNGGVVSSEQKDWLDGLKECGWLTAVCFGADRAIALIKSLGYDPRYK